MSGHDERARHEKPGRHGDADEHEQHAGNGTVNHGPLSENSGPQEPGHSDTEGHLPGPPSDDPSAISSAASSATSSDGPSAASPAVSSGTPQDGSGPDGSALAKAAFGDASGDSGTGSVGTGSVRTEPAGPEAEPAGPEAEPAGPETVGAGGTGTGSDEAVPDVFGSDELGLRRLLHQAVEEIEPTDGTLDHLRRAVPARRARKRQALVGAAAAALFIGTAVPALLHVSNATGSDADPSMAGAASATQGGTNEGKEASAGSDSGDSSGSAKGSGKGGKKDESGKGKGDTGSTAGAEPSASAASAPTCTSAQLAAVDGGATAPDGVGAVYGTFTVTNVSTTTCTVVGGGSVSPAALGAADQSKLSTLLHVAGDPAAGLPDPSTYASSLVLRPGGAYAVKFAWVPSETCPTSGGNGGEDPTPDPTPTSNPSGGTSDGTTGESAQLMRADGTVDGSVNESNAAEGGAPTAATAVSNACAGTVYRTGLLSGA